VGMGGWMGGCVFAGGGGHVAPGPIILLQVGVWGLARLFVSMCVCVHV